MTISSEYFSYLPPEVKQQLDEVMDGTDSSDINDGAVTADKLATNAVTTVKINDLAVTTGKLNDLSVTTGKLNDLGVTTGKLNDLGVTTGKLAASAVTVAKAAVFSSAETTATGSEQSVAHGLGVVPALVMISMTEHPGTPDTGAMDIAEGTHTSTNVVFTATANIKVKILAWA